MTVYPSEDTTTGNEDGMVTRTPAQSDHSLKVYIECAIINFTANEVAEDKHAAVFLIELSERAYTILRNPVAPDLPRVKSFDQDHHFSGKSL